MLFLVSGLWLGVSANAQTNQIDTVDCNYYPWAGVSDWVIDAKRLALREIFVAQDSYKDSIQIPASRYMPILEDIQGIYLAGQPYITDSIFSKYKIHTCGSPNMEQIYMHFDPNYSWVQQWAMGNILSTNDTVDALMNNFGLVLVNLVTSSSPYDGYVWTTYPLNVHPLGTFFASISGISSVYAGDFQVVSCDGSDIIRRDSTTFREYIFRYSAGDCPAGCTINHYWKFRVYPDCAVQYVGSWGTPLQHPTSIIEPTTNNFFSISPNPATTSVSITTGDEVIGSTITVTDITGRKVLAAQLSTQNSALTTSNFANGVYLLTLTTTSGQAATKKLVISK